ncbi:hypothetical protein L7F22_056837 [Adiantum nelumboides]|nr:hypothetical protein [Adiantum nelumboides]
MHTPWPRVYARNRIRSRQRASPEAPRLQGRTGNDSSDVLSRVLRPSSSSGKREEVRADDFIAAASKFSKSGQLDEVLAGAGGALHFRGTPLRSADDFSRFMHALSEGGQWTPQHVDKGLMVLRKAPCQKRGDGKRGPARPAHRVAQRVRPVEPPPVVHCLFLPLGARRRWRERPSPRAWHSTTGSRSGRRSCSRPRREGRRLFDPPPPATPSKATCRATGYDAKWLPDGSLLSVQRVPGVRLHPRYGSKTFFNNIHNRLLYSRLHKATEPPHVSQTQTTALGTPFYQKPPQLVDEEEDRLFPRDWIETIEEITAELQVDVKWNKGDVLLLDNLAVQHARRPWKGDRRLLASLWDRTAL